VEMLHPGVLAAGAPGDDEEGEGAEPPWQDALLDVQLALLSRPAGALPSAPLRDAVEALFRATCHLLTSTGPLLPCCPVELNYSLSCVLLSAACSDGRLHSSPSAGTAAGQVEVVATVCTCAVHLVAAQCTMRLRRTRSHVTVMCPPDAGARGLGLTPCCPPAPLQGCRT
jgi:hypothetical protein